MSGQSKRPTVEVVPNGEYDQKVLAQTVKSVNGLLVERGFLLKGSDDEKADIIVQIGWTLTSSGMRSSLNFTMSAIDSSSNKQVANATRTVSSFSSDPSLLIEEALLTSIDEFNEQLMEYFLSMPR